MITEPPYPGNVIRFKHYKGYYNRQEYKMAISDALVAEFDHEMQGTRKTLERVPDDKFDWKPHEKSYTMQALSSHLANIPTWMTMTLNQESLDVMPEGEPEFKSPQAKDTAELLRFFDENVAEARKVLAGTGDQTFMQNWTLLAGGQEVFTMPKIAVVRAFIFSHIIHHRAQLTVYLRMNGAPVPALYGPSADEDGM